MRINLSYLTGFFLAACLLASPGALAATCLADEALSASSSMNSSEPTSLLRVQKTDNAVLVYKDLKKPIRIELAPGEKAKDVELFGKSSLTMTIVSKANPHDVTLRFYQLNKSGSFDLVQELKDKKATYYEWVEALNDNFVLLMHTAKGPQDRSTGYIYKKNKKGKFEPFKQIAIDYLSMMGVHPENENLVFLSAKEPRSLKVDTTKFQLAETVFMFNLKTEALTTIVDGIVDRKGLEEAMISYEPPWATGSLTDTIFYLAQTTSRSHIFRQFEKLFQVTKDGKIKDLGGIDFEGGRRTVHALSADRFILLDDNDKSRISGADGIPRHLRTYTRHLELRSFGVNKGKLKEEQGWLEKASFQADDERAVGLSVFPLNKSEFLLFGKGQINVYRDDGKGFKAEESFDLLQTKFNGFASSNPESEPYVLNGNEMGLVSVSPSKFILYDKSRISGADGMNFRTEMYGFEKIDGEFRNIGGIRLEGRLTSPPEVMNAAGDLLLEIADSQAEGAHRVKSLSWSELKD